MIDLQTLKAGGELVNDKLPAIQKIVNTVGSRIKTVNIPTDSLNFRGRAVQDSFEKYLDNEYNSSSLFKEAYKTPFHYFYALNDKSELEKAKGANPSFKIGTFIHQCILEPSKFKRAIVEPFYSLASLEGCSKGVEFWENLIYNNSSDVLSEEKILQDIKQIAIDECGRFESMACKKVYLKKLVDYSGVQTVSELDYYKIGIIKRHIDMYSDGIIYDIFKHSKREISMYADIEGIKHRIRPDGLQFSENIGLDCILSVKSSQMEDLRSFYAQAAKLHYDLSEYMYQHVASHVTGRNFSNTITLLLQTVPPFAVALLIWSDEDIEVGRYKYSQARETIKSIQEGNIPIGYETYAEPGHRGIIEMRLPDWNKMEKLTNQI